jgi:hypothetical protein
MWAFDSRRHQGRAHNVNDDIVMVAHTGGCVEVCPFTQGGEAKGSQ